MDMGVLLILFALIATALFLRRGDNNWPDGW